MTHHGGLNMHFKLLREVHNTKVETPKLDNSQSNLEYERIIYSLMKALNAIMDSAPGLYESQFVDYNQSVLNKTQIAGLKEEDHEII